MQLTQDEFETGTATISANFLDQRRSKKRRLTKLLETFCRKKALVWEVQTTTIDSFTRYSNIRVDLIKLDCEGHEVDCLKGATKLLEQQNHVIVIEVHINETGSNLDEYIEFFDAVKYDVFMIMADPQRSSWHLRHIVDADVMNGKQYNLLAMARS